MLAASPHPPASTQALPTASWESLLFRKHAWRRLLGSSGRQTVQQWLHRGQPRRGSGPEARAPLLCLSHGGSRSDLEVVWICRHHGRGGRVGLLDRPREGGGRQVQAVGMAVLFPRDLDLTAYRARRGSEVCRPPQKMATGRIRVTCNTCVNPICRCSRSRCNRDACS